MAKYTATLGDIVESGFDLGLDDYPIFDENYRVTLNDKIIEHYWDYEIGRETAYSFKRILNMALNEIMPKYNKFYKAELLTISPLTTFEKNSSSSKQKESESVKDQDSTIIKDQETTTVKDQDSVIAQVINNNSSLDNITTSNTNDSQNVENILSQNSSTNNTTEKDTTTTNNLTVVKSDTPQNELLIGDLENNLYASEGTVNKENINLDDNINVNENSNLDKNETIKTNTDSLTTNTTDTNSKSATTSDTTNSIDDTTTSSLDDTTTSSIDDITKINESETSQNLENGFDRPQSELLMMYRETFIDVDTMIIHDSKIRECFMMIY